MVVFAKVHAVHEAHGVNAGGGTPVVERRPLGAGEAVEAVEGTTVEGASVALGIAAVGKIGRRAEADGGAPLIGVHKSPPPPERQ